MCVRLLYNFFSILGITHEGSHLGSKKFNILYRYQRIQIIYFFFCNLGNLCSLKNLSMFSKLSSLLSEVFFFFFL